MSRQEVTVRGLLAMLADYPRRVSATRLRATSSLPDVDVVLYDTLCLHRREATELDQMLATPGVTVLVYSRDMRPDLRARALAKGCTAWVSMSASADDLVHAVELAAAGECPAEQASSLDRDTVLTAREIEILSLITHGLSNREITERLELSANTLKTHIRQIYRKIGARSRAQAVAWALQDGYMASENA